MKKKYFKNKFEEKNFFCYCKIIYIWFFSSLSCKFHHTISVSLTYTEYLLLETSAPEKYCLRMWEHRPNILSKSVTTVSTDANGSGIL